METFLRGLTYETRLVYQDDVIMIGRTFQEHLLNLRRMFQGIQNSPSKSQSGEVPNFRRKKVHTSGIFCHLKG